MVELHPEHARAVLDTLALGIMLIDRDERISWVNTYGVNLLAATPAALLGRAVTELDLPYAPFSEAGGLVQVRTNAHLIGLTQRYEHPGAAGTTLMLLERGHALNWFSSALANCVSGAVAGTGMLSRSSISSRLDGEISRSRRYTNQLSCITTRLRGAAAAARMGELARALKSQLRWVDVLGQWQDDALVVVLPETDGDAARILRDKLAIELRLPSYPVAVELGVSSWRRGESAEQLVERALLAGHRALPAIRSSGGG